jgi:hypothetical protein
LEECTQNIEILKGLVEVVQNLEKAEPETDIFTVMLLIFLIPMESMFHSNEHFQHHLQELVLTA